MSPPAESPTVSVIIPSYNHAHYVGLAISSVLAQTYDDWETIVVDDGSTDETATVVGRFSDPRIQYLYQKNQGLSAARNAGIRAARGEYLAFLDADDEWEPEFLRHCVDVLASDDTLGGVYTHNYFIDENGTVLPQLGGRVVPPAVFHSRNLEGGFFSTGATLIRTDVICEVGLFDTKLTSEEDWDLWIRISRRFGMRGIPEPLARYRVYPGSMSTNAARMHANRIAVLTKYFGPPEGDPTTWPEEKRRVYGFAYRSAAYRHIWQGQADDGWHFLAQAFSTWPNLLYHLSTFYELACGDQPNGYRGQAEMLDIESNGAEMLERLDRLLGQAGPGLEPMHRSAYGNAYLALSMLSDQAGHWTIARRYLFKAVKANPRLLVSYPVVRRLLKLCTGWRLVNIWRRAFGHGRVPQRFAKSSGAGVSQSERSTP